ncbi:MAG: phosphoglycolate phosphatase [Sulfitobacter sp.]
MANVTAIVFDLDGTLIHSAPDLQFAANAALHSIGRGPLDLATIISFIGNGVETLVKRAVAATGGGDDTLERAVLAVFLDVYAENITTLTRPYDGVIQALEQFRAKGVKLGICTNKPTGPAQNICDRLELSQYFDVVVGAEPDQPKKPDPHALLACLSRLGCPPAQAIYVGDSTIDFHTARNAAVAFRLFSEGYLNEPLPELSTAARFDNWREHGIVVG